jgi:hypothetical protein
MTRATEDLLSPLDAPLRALIRDEIRRCVRHEVLRSLDEDDLAQRAHEAASRLKLSRTG